MAWDRRGKFAYYYRSRREGSRVIRQYIGKGFDAERAARADSRKAAIRAAGKAAIQRELALTLEARRFSDELNDFAKLLMEAELLAAGFHRINYGPWRRKNGFRGNRR